MCLLEFSYFECGAYGRTFEGTCRQSAMLWHSDTQLVLFSNLLRHGMRLRSFGGLGGRRTLRATLGPRAWTRRPLILLKRGNQ